MGGGILIPFANWLAQQGRFSHGTTKSIRAKAMGQVQVEGASSVGRGGAPSESNGTASGKNGARFAAWAVTFERPSVEFVFAAAKAGSLGLWGIPQQIVLSRLKAQYQDTDGLVTETYRKLAGSEKSAAVFNSEEYVDELQVAEPVLALAQMVAVVASGGAGAERGAGKLSALVKNVGKRKGVAKAKPRPTSGKGKGTGGTAGRSPDPATRNGWQMTKHDLDWRGTGRGHREALDAAFAKTGRNRSEFEITKWGRDAHGKSFPSEWRTKDGAEVNIDWAHSNNGPAVPHVGWQTAGKRGRGGGKRGHILLDDVPYNR